MARPGTNEERSSRRRAPAGVVATEMALVVPILLLFGLASADFGRVAYFQQIVTNAARTAVDVGATRQFTSFTRAQWEADVRLAALEELQNAPAFDESELEYDLTTTTDDDGITRLAVSLAAPFRTVVNWPGLPSEVLLHARIEARPISIMARLIVTTDRIHIIFRPRSGATAVECAFVLPVTIFVLFSLLDLGLAATRYNALAEGARRVARQAILHGSLSPAASERWGPAEFAGSADDDASETEPLHGVLPTMPADDVAVNVTWPDGNNSPRDRVRVELNFEHKSLVPFMAAWGPIELNASTTMRIVN